ncbi:MAG: HPF/RaiA family ribosome-associated protein [Planctomycetota bacterium]
MLVSIIDRDDLVTRESQEVAERRLLFALSRFDARIQNVELIVSDLNGPRGGVDKSCRVQLKTQWGSEIVMTDSDSDLISCISRLADRVGRAVARAIERKQTFPRTRASEIGSATI